MLADRMKRRSAWGSSNLVALMMAIAAPVAMAAYLVDDWRLAAWLLGLHFFLNALYYGTLFSTYMTMAPIAMRGTLAALLSVVMTLMGYGLGPVVSGVASDLYASAGISEPLRWAQVTTACGFLVAAMLFAATARAIRRQEIRGDAKGASLSAG
jgi:MFS family permease